MTDQVVADVGPEPTAIEPSRILELNDDEQHLVLRALNELGDVGRALLNRIAYGDEYWNATDELVRTTLRKRRLEAEVRRCNITIERVEEQVVEELADRGDTGGKHAGTGASYRLERKVWAKLDVDVDGLPKDQADEIKAQHKARVADALIQLEDLAAMVRNDFNLNSVSAYFREAVKAYDAEQQDLPEHKRQPRPVEAFLPEQLRGLLRLDDTPTISVRA